MCFKHNARYYNTYSPASHFAHEISYTRMLSDFSSDSRLRTDSATLFSCTVLLILASFLRRTSYLFTFLLSYHIGDVSQLGLLYSADGIGRNSILLLRVAFQFHLCPLSDITELSCLPSRVIHSYITARVIGHFYLSSVLSVLT